MPNLARLLLLSCPVLLATTVAAQCQPAWLPGFGWNGTDNTVFAATNWDPDGPGPLPAVTVVAGYFQAAGKTVAQSIAILDPVTGNATPFGGGIDGLVYALAALPNGDLIAGGAFTSAGGVPTANIARWNGSWNALGQGTSATVRALTVLSNGDLVAGGDFLSAGGGAAARIARWDGTAWSALGTGITGNSVLALATLPNGDLWATGSFSAAGAVAANGIARWDGAAWSALGSGLMLAGGPGSGTSIALGPNGHIAVAGSFDTAFGVPANRVAEWDGSTWSARSLGGRIAFLVSVGAVAFLPNGTLIAGGRFNLFGGVNANSIAFWSGTEWAPMGTGILGGPLPTVYSLYPLPTGDLLVGGSFTGAGGVGVANVALWNGAAWSAIGTTLDGWVQCTANLPNGDLVVGGVFSTIGGVPATGVARRSGGVWSPLASLLGSVNALAVLPNGDLIAGGDFTTPGQLQINRIARWNGSSWQRLGTGLTGGSAVITLAVLQNGDLVAGGFFSSAGGVPANNIARWDGTAWSPLGAGTNLTVRAIVELPNGDLLVGGNFSTAGGSPANGLARWDGASWSPLGAGVTGSVNSLQRLANGDVLVGGDFVAIDGQPLASIARWNGTTWAPLGAGFAGPVRATLELPDGDLLAAGLFTNGGSLLRVARFDGTAWQPVGTGANDAIFTLGALPNGNVVAGGYLTQVDGLVSRGFADLVTPCPATAVTFANGCPSSGGQNQLAAVTLPWVDSTMRTRGTGLPTMSIVVAATGFAALVPGFPLDTVFPQAPPGCVLHVDPLIQQPQLTTTGTADSLLPLPNTPPLVGVVFRQQMVVIEVDAFLNFLQVTATNALEFVPGDF